jgi:hypothetical protein
MTGRESTCRDRPRQLKTIVGCIFSYSPSAKRHTTQASHERRQPATGPLPPASRESQDRSNYGNKSIGLSSVRIGIADRGHRRFYAMLRLAPVTCNLSSLKDPSARQHYVCMLPTLREYMIGAV